MAYTRVTDGVNDVLASYHNELIDGLEQFPGPRDFMINGKISVAVVSNDLVVSLLTLDGSTPSTTNPVGIRIGSTMRKATASTTVLVAAGFNTFNAGSSELATKEIDYFVYLVWDSDSSIVGITCSRIPNAHLVSGFSATYTDETYCANYGAFSTGDAAAVIGRFAATLSAGAGYTWTVPSFSSVNLIQRPIYSTRWLDWQPAYSASGSMTYTTVTTNEARYRLDSGVAEILVDATGTTGGTASNTLYATLPISAQYPGASETMTAQVADTTSITGYGWVNGGTPDQVAARRYDAANYGLGAARIMRVKGRYWHT